MKVWLSSLTIAGLLALATPTLSSADTMGWYQGRALLERQLSPSRTPADYRLLLQNMGYTVTAENYNAPNYVEYEIVKGNRSYEVKIHLHEPSGRATAIDVDANVWKTERTEAALARNDTKIR